MVTKDARATSYKLIRRPKFTKGPLGLISVTITLWSFFNEFMIYGAKRHKSYERIKSRLIPYYKASWRDYFLRIVAGTTLIAFLNASVVHDYAWAAKAPGELTSVGSDRGDGPSLSDDAQKDVNRDHYYTGHLGTIRDLGPQANTLWQALKTSSSNHPRR